MCMLREMKQFLILLMFVCSGSVYAANQLLSVQLKKEDSKKEILVVDFTQALPASPVHFSISNPHRVVFDFPDTQLDPRLDQRVAFPAGMLGSSVQMATQGGRTRMVFHVQQGAVYRPKVDGTRLFVELSKTNHEVLNDTSAPIADETVPDQPLVSDSAKARLGKVDFRRLSGQQGGRLLIDLRAADVRYDVRRQGRHLVVDFPARIFARGYDRRYSVSDFGTLVRQFDVRNNGRGSRIIVHTDESDWEYSSFQTATLLTIELRKKGTAYLGRGRSVATMPGGKVEGSTTGVHVQQQYRGQRLSLNFQSIDVRTVLQVIADFTGMNIIASDEVAGRITLRLKDVPWDQALDIIMQSKGLDMRQVGNVIHIAPRERLLERDKARLRASQQLEDLEELRSETFRLRYKKVDEFKQILDSASGEGKRFGLLSKRGSALIDPKTNILIINDVASNIEKVRNLLRDLDIPARQVMIEARIVEASDTFQRDLGVKLGFGDVTGRPPGSQISIGGNLENAIDNLNVFNANEGELVLAPNVNTVVGGDGGASVGAGANTIGLVFRRGLARLIGLEILAGQAEGRTKILSNPKVMTTDRVNARIESGTQVGYVSAVTDEGPKVDFKDAVLALDVTPQITNNDEIIMDLSVTNDEPGANQSISKKNITTQVRVENGGTLVIGGVFKKTQTDAVNKVPILGDIPILGRLFRADTKQDNNTELLIFITPTIVENRGS